jgi:hypothetical protein
MKERDRKRETEREKRGESKKLRKGVKREKKE